MDYLHEHSTGLTICWIRKCGCTLLKNVFHYLNSGDVYPEALAIHTDGRARAISALPSPEYEALDIAKSFVVIRDPVARLASFYWDKIYSTAPTAAKSTKERLENLARVRSPDFKGFDRSDSLSLDGHVRNVLAMLDGIQEVLENPDKWNPDLHFAPQVFAIERSNALEFTKLRLEEFRDGGPEALRIVSPGFLDAVKKIPRAHESVKKFSNDELLNDEIIDKINEIYLDDIEMYDGSRKPRMQGVEIGGSTFGRDGAIAPSVEPTHSPATEWNEHRDMTTNALLQASHTLLASLFPAGLSALEEEFSTLKKELSELKGLTQSQETELETSKSSLMRSIRSAKASETARRDVEAQLSEVSKERQALASERDAVQTEKDNLLAKVDALKGQLIGRHADLDKQKAALSAAKQTMKTVQNEQHALEAQLKEAIAARDDAVSAAKAQQVALDEAKQSAAASAKAQRALKKQFKEAASAAEAQQVMLDEAKQSATSSEKTQLALETRLKEAVAARNEAFARAEELEVKLKGAFNVPTWLKSNKAS